MNLKVMTEEVELAFQWAQTFRPNSDKVPRSELADDFNYQTATIICDYTNEDKDNYDWLEERVDNLEALFSEGKALGLIGDPIQASCPNPWNWFWKFCEGKFHPVMFGWVLKYSSGKRLLHFLKNENFRDFNFDNIWNPLPYQLLAQNEGFIGLNENGKALTVYREFFNCFNISIYSSSNYEIKRFLLSRSLVADNITLAGRMRPEIAEPILYSFITGPISWNQMMVLASDQRRHSGQMVQDPEPELPIHFMEWVGTYYDLPDLPLDWWKELIHIDRPRGR